MPHQIVESILIFFHDRNNGALTSEQIAEIDKDPGRFHSECLILGIPEDKHTEFCYAVEAYITEKCEKIGNIPEYCYC